MSHTVLHTRSQYPGQPTHKVEIKEIGDPFLIRVNPRNPFSRPVAGVYKHTRKLQNRSKYAPH